MDNLKNNSPHVDIKYHLQFEGVEYNVIYHADNTMQSVCTSANLEHHPSRIGQIKNFKINRFEICSNIWCSYWNTNKISIVYIEDYNKMSINAIMTLSDMTQIRESGTISIV